MNINFYMKNPMLRLFVPCAGVWQWAPVLAALLVLLPDPARAASPVEEAFRAGIAAEEIARDPAEAFSHYETALRLHAADRAVAASAQVRMADLFKRQGQTDRAVAAYRQVITEFPDQTNLVQLVRPQVPESPPDKGLSAGLSGPNRKRELIQDEIALLEADLQETRKRLDNGSASPAEVRRVERDLLRLRREWIDAAPKVPLDIAVAPAVEPNPPRPSEDALENRRREFEAKLGRQEELLRGTHEEGARFLLREQPTSALTSIQARLDDLELKLAESGSKLGPSPEDAKLMIEQNSRTRDALRQLLDKEVKSIFTSIERQTDAYREELKKLSEMIRKRSEEVELFNIRTGETRTLNWEIWSPEKATALLADKQPVYVDFTAGWCTTCQVNRRIFSEPAVQALLREHHVATLTANWDQENESIRRVLETFGRRTVPVNILYVPGLAEPIVLEEILTVANVTAALNKIR